MGNSLWLSGYSLAVFTGIYVVMLVWHVVVAATSTGGAITTDPVHRLSSGSRIAPGAVGIDRLERDRPPTGAFADRGPIPKLRVRAPSAGFEPATPASGGQCSIH